MADNLSPGAVDYVARLMFGVTKFLAGQPRDREWSAKELDALEQARMEAADLVRQIEHIQARVNGR